ncbi:MAG: histidine kinase, partial [Bacteroidota bacterium]
YNIFSSDYSVKFGFYVLIQAVAVYFNLYYLLPRYLEKGRFGLYIFSFLLTTLVATAAIVSGYFVGAYLSDLTFEELYKIAPADYFDLVKFNALPSTLAAMTLGLSIKLAKNWLQMRQRQQLLEKEKLETELKFLRAQFNPHFLFNTINSIFVLIHKNPDMASESLAKFSGLLRYQLYECNEQQIPLQQEITYLENFIELEKLRQDYIFDLQLDIDRNSIGSLNIAPFLLIPFVENAFKHLSRHTDRPNWINIRLYCQGGHLFFNISNSSSAQHVASEQVLSPGGIGLKNVQRRLDLIYPGNYLLQINPMEAVFKVQFRLKLATDRAANSIALEAQGV